LKMYINEGYPVIVLQKYSFSESDGHNRVVIGYSDKRKMVITNDPSPFGPNMSQPTDSGSRVSHSLRPRAQYLIFPFGEKI